MSLQRLLEQWLQAHPEIELAILFGSEAKNSARPDSDVDLAIQLQDAQTLQAESKLDYIGQLSVLLNKPIDLVDLSTLGQPLLSQIMKYGRCLTKDKAPYCALAIKNVNTAEDFLPYLERMFKQRRKRWLKNG